MAQEPKEKLTPLKKTSSEGDLPETADEWVSYVNKLHDAGLESRRKTELQWVLNLAYYLGYSNLIYDNRIGILRLPTDSKKPLTVNRIGSYVEARHSKLSKNKPITRVLPETNEMADKRGAKYADQALTFLWRKIGMDAEYDRLLMMMLISGTAFMKTVWDPMSGDVIKDYKKSSDGKDLIISEEGDLALEKTPMGEVSSRAKSAFSIIPANDNITQLKDQPWIIERSHIDISEIEARFPHLRGKIKLQSKEETMTQYEKMVARLGAPSFHTGGPSQDAKDSINGQVLVKTLWVKPNWQYENGVLVIVAGDQLAFIDKWPNDFGDSVYPFVRFTEKEDGFHFWGQSTVERLIPIQRAYDRIRQHIDSNAALMAKGKWLLPKGSQVSSESLDDTSGEVIEYNPNVTPPSQASLAPLPNYIIEHQQTLLTDFRDCAGQREVSMSPGANLTASVAMQTQAEMSEEIMGSIVRRLADSMEAVAHTQLMLMDQEWDDPRKVKIFGAQGQIGVEWMSNVDFRHHTDVRVEVESMLPDFRASKRQMLLDLWDRRIIQDPKTFMEVFRFGDWDALVEKEELLEDQIIMDIQAMKKGKEPEITPFQNHMLYIKKFSQFMQTPEFLRLIPERKQLFITQLQNRLAMVMQQMPGQGAPQMMTKQNAVGTPFGPEVPPGMPGESGTPVAVA